MKIGLLGGKLLLRDEKIHLVDDDINEDCCCEGEETCTSCMVNYKLRRHCDTPPPEGYDPIENPGPFGTHWRYNNCHRLLVYSGIEICNTRIRNAGIEPDYALVTNAEANLDGNPFYVTYNDPESGLLDTTPLWWSDCRVGGWDTGTVSLLPTIQNIHDTWDCCKSLIEVGSGEPTTITNGTYRMYVLMGFRRSYLYDTMLNTTILKNPESTAAAYLVWVKLSYQGTIEDCDPEEITRGDCPNTSYPPDCP